ncbi:hypothetical protein Tco_0127485 [Tanacetum coccineum]
MDPRIHPLVDPSLLRDICVSENTGESMPQINQNDYHHTKAYLPRIHRSKATDEKVRESYHRLESRLFHEGIFVTPSFIKANNMLLTFQAVGLESFLTLDEPNCPRFNHSNPTSKRHQQLHIDDIHPELRRWELFFRENFYCTLGNSDHVNACTTYMLYYLTIKRKFNFTLVILYRMEEVENKSNGHMPFAMLLTCHYNYILRTNPQAIIPPNWFTFHDRYMNPLDISRNPIKEKGNSVAFPSVSSSSSSLSDENEAPSFLESYEEHLTIRT